MVGAMLNAEAVEIHDIKSKQAMHDNSIPVVFLWLIIVVLCRFIVLSGFDD
jgi:hypothetical protein